MHAPDYPWRSVAAGMAAGGLLTYWRNKAKVEAMIISRETFAAPDDLLAPTHASSAATAGLDRAGRLVALELKHYHPISLYLFPRSCRCLGQAPSLATRLVLVGMVVAPSPVCFLILFFRLGKIYMLAMIRFLPPAISLVFILVPCMIIVMVSVMIFLVVSAQRQRRHCHRNQKGGTD